MNEEAKALAYESVKGLVYELCHRFGGGTRDEDVVAEAHLGFAKALATHEVGKGALTTHVYWKVRGQLSDLRRRWHSRQQYREIKFCDMDVPADGPGAEALFAQGSSFGERLRQLLSELSEDAALVLELALVPSPAKEDPAAKRDGIVRFLLDLGWAGKRVLETFEEIAEALG